MTDAPNPPATQRRAGQIIARNTLFGLGAQFVLRMASFIFTIAVVRTLGDENFGQYSIILAWVGLFSVIGDLGINQYLAREIARDQDKANQFFWDTVVLRLFLAVAAMIVTVGGALVFTDYSTDIIIGITIFTSTYFLQAMMAPLDSLLRGNERIDITAVLEVVNQILFMVLAGSFLFLGFNFIWLVIASLIAIPVQIILAYLSIRRSQIGIPHFRINARLWFSVIKAGIPFAITQLALSFSYQVDTIFLSTYTTNEVVGWYNAGYRLTLTLVTVSGAFFRALQPTMAREHANNPDSVRPWYHTSTRFIIMISVPIAVGGALLSGDIVRIFGNEYLPASLALAILLWDLPFVLYNSFCGRIANAMQKEKDAARIFVSVGIINVALNAIFIPTLGLVGACFATVITDMFGTGLFYKLYRKRLGAGLQIKRILRILIATVVMGVEVLLLQHLNIFLLIGMGGITYASLIIRLGGLSHEEYNRVVGLIADKSPTRLQSVFSYMYLNH